jgi:hypothetical protein
MASTSLCFTPWDAELHGGRFVGVSGPFFAAAPKSAKLCQAASGASGIGQALAVLTPLFLIANQFIPLFTELLFKLVDLLGCVGFLGFEGRARSCVLNIR